MLDSVSKVERYHKEAIRCAELAKEASPPFLAEPGGDTRQGSHLKSPGTAAICVGAAGGGKLLLDARKPLCQQQAVHGLRPKK
jgi:hypothetical protein